VVGSGCGALRCRVRAVLDVVGSGCGALCCRVRALFAPYNNPQESSYIFEQQQVLTPSKSCSLSLGSCDRAS